MCTERRRSGSVCDVIQGASAAIPSRHPRHQAPPCARLAGLGLQPLLPGGQPARRARGHHALGVGVPAPAVIALGEHQQVLAHGRQVAPAQGTAVGRRLEVLSPPELRAEIAAEMREAAEVYMER